MGRSLSAIVLFALLACAKAPTCPPHLVAPTEPIATRPAEKPASAPRLFPPSAGTRSGPDAPLKPGFYARKTPFVGCDLHYRDAPVGSTISLRWFVYEDLAGYEANDPVNETAGRFQDVHDDGLIQAYLQSKEGEFQPGIYVCDFALLRDGKEIVPHERAGIWIAAPPTSPSTKTP